MIVVEGLSKSFGRAQAVHDLSFTAAPGSITGFLGPNGAGKTTTLRMLLGLVRPTAGRARIDGRPYAALDRPAERVGAVLEATGFHPGRSARDHLRVCRAAAGLAEDRVEEVLTLVALLDVADRPVSGFSHGMRQRLALATALLGRPGVLVLDEPANGLDPAGIQWLRTLLRSLADGGRTVLVSSHMLTEIEHTADHIVIIARGRLVRDAPLAELTRTDGTLRVRTLQPAELVAALRRAGAAVRDAGDHLTVSGVGAEEVGRAALAAGAVLTELTEGRTGLEEVFLELTRSEFAHADAMGAPGSEK